MMGKQVIRVNRSVVLCAGVLAVVGLCLAPTAGYGQATTPVPNVKASVVQGFTGVEQVELINEHLRDGWKNNKIKPSDRCSDYEFIRRASLDIIGRIATQPEILEYMSQPEKTRRSWLIDRLLTTEEYANNFAGLWTTLMLTRSSAAKYREKTKEYLSQQFQNDVGWNKTVTEILTATGSSDENGAVNFILAHLGEKNNDTRGEGLFDMVPITSRTTKLFLGIQTQCTQCHDHPFNDVWQQKHFWSMNAFFRQVEATGVAVMANNQVAGVRTLGDNELNADGIIPYERRNGVLLYAKSRYLDGTRIAPDSKKTRRQELAYMITHDSYFAKAYINRMWHHFFGVSFTKDHEADFGEHNPVSHPDLLDRLGRDWSDKFEHSPKELIRWICNSEAYSLSSKANETNTSPDSKRFFSRVLLKAMTPEQLFESLMKATQAKAAENNEDRKKLRVEFLDRLVDQFGDDEGNGTTFNGTVVQALMLMNGKEINKAIMDKEFGTVGIILKAKGMTPQKAIYHLYMATYNRPPREEELKVLLSDKMYKLYRLPQKMPGQPGFWDAYYQDLFWAVLNSNEFFLNH